MPTATGSTPANFELTFVQNADWSGVFSVTDAAGENVDLTDCSVTAYVWARPVDTDPDAPTFTYTSDAGYITIDDTDNEWTWEIAKEDFDSLTTGGIFQVYLTYSDGSQDRTHEGTFALKKHGSLC